MLPRSCSRRPVREAWTGCCGEPPHSVRIRRREQRARPWRLHDRGVTLSRVRNATVIAEARADGSETLLRRLRTGGEWSSAYVCERASVAHALASDLLLALQSALKITFALCVLAVVVKQSAELALWIVGYVLPLNGALVFHHPGGGPLRGNAPPHRRPFRSRGPRVSRKGTDDLRREQSYLLDRDRTAEIWRHLPASRAAGLVRITAGFTAAAPPSDRADRFV